MNEPLTEDVAPATPTNRFIGALVVMAAPVLLLLYVIIILTLCSYAASSLRGALDAIANLF